MTHALVPTTKRPTRSLFQELLVGAGAVSIALALPCVMALNYSTNFTDATSGWQIIAVMSLLALASYPLSRAANFLAQLFARAIWWQALVFGGVLALGCTFGDVNGAIVYAIPMYVLGAAFAIGGAGRVGLDFESAHFFPAEFRRSLMASLVMAMADTIALLFYSGILLTEGHSITTATLVDVAQFSGAAFVMSVAIFGLYRIKVWGLALNIVANVAIAGLAITGVFDVPEFIAFGLAATAIAQLLLPLPLLKRIFFR